MVCAISVDGRRKRYATYCGPVNMLKKFGRIASSHFLLTSCRIGVSWTWLPSYRGVIILGLGSWSSSSQFVRGIWKNRNDLRMGGKGKAGRTVLRNAMHLVEEFRAANEGKTEHQVDPIPPVSWKPPNPGYYKVNCDGAVFSSSKQAGAGVIVRDGAGEVIAALSKKWKCPLGAIEAEAKALEAGVEFAKDVGIREAEFESDSLLVCNALHGLDSAPSSVMNVLDGVLNQMSNFRQWKVTHTKRQGNVPAHLLAQHAKNVEDYVAWLEECPRLIEHACLHDRNVTA